MTDTNTVGKAAHRWWAAALRDDGSGRLARAKLRHCETPTQALAIEATHELHAALGGRLEHRADTLALIAIALANVRTFSPQSAAERMGDSLTALRFQTLIRSETALILIRPLRRALVQIDQTANVNRLASDLFYWGEETRNRWCFAYYGATLSPFLSNDETDLSASETEE